MRLLALFAALFASGPAFSATQVWLIGGGNSLGNSQGQIEDTVRWLQGLLGERNVHFRTYFTSGKESAIDVSYYVDVENRDPRLDRILRVFGDQNMFAIRTRRNALGRVDGPTEKEQLVAGLRRDLAKVRPEDSILIVYVGHGDVDYDDATRNALKLWRDGRLNVREFARVLDEVDPKTTIRFIMTQCFSGAFASAAFVPPLGLNRTSSRRCGFFSQSETREAEGCDLSINRSEYRDYSTYFFSALLEKSSPGRERNSDDRMLGGKRVDGYVAAHYYALRNGRSLDLPRSTSEIYLDKSQPWYLRWNSFALGRADDRYLQASRAIAEREGIPAVGSLLVLEAERRAGAKNAAEGDVKATAKEISGMQAKLRSSVVERYPGVARDYFWVKISERELSTIADYVAQVPGYAELKAMQDRQDDNFSRYMSAARAEGLAQRVLWLNRLARLRRYEVLLPSSAKESLKALRECEDGQL